MFAHFTAEAREAVVFAQEEAARLRHSWLGTEHLLVGLLRRTHTPASQVLSSLRVTAASAEQALLEELGPAPSGQVLGDADERALRTLGIDTDHLLLGMTEVRGALAVRLLERLGVTGDAVRAQVDIERRRAS